MSGGRRGAAALVTALALTLGTAGCTGGPEPAHVDPSSSTVPLRGCDQVACTGTLDGAAYEIVLPASWNGTLLIYSHGYRAAQPAPPDFAPVSTAPEPAPGWSSGDRSVGAALLDRGYALAGSAYARNGWAVSDGVAAAEQLRDFVVAHVGQPTRTYLWGDSLGGLITQVVAERHPDWVDGVAPFCGALAGIVPNLDLALDVAYGTERLLDPGLQLTGFATYQDAVRAFQRAARRVVAAASDPTGEDAAAIAYLGALADAPSRTRTFDGASAASRRRATAEGIVTALAFGVVGRYEVEQRFGGNPSTNVATDYAQRISAAEAAQVDALSSDASATFTAALQDGARVAADAGARARALVEGGDPQGVVSAPTITLHTVADPLVVMANESYFRARFDSAVARGDATAGDLLPLFTEPPARYPEDPGAPYGAGHCNFTGASRLAVIDLLDTWVREGAAPTPADVAAAFGAGSGLAPGYRPGPWPG